MQIFLSVFRTCLREMHFAKEVFFNRFFKLPKRQMFSFVQIDPGVTLRKLMAFLELIWGHTLKTKKLWYGSFRVNTQCTTGYYRVTHCFLVDLEFHWEVGSENGKKIMEI